MINKIFQTLKNTLKLVGFQSKKEFLIFAFISFFVLICANAGHIYHWLNTQPGDFYLGYGGSTYNGDINAYLMRINQGIRGEWLFEEWYTPEPTTKSFMYFPYLALGHLARIFRLDTRVALHLGRLLATPFLFFGLYALLSAFRFTEKQRTAFYPLLALPVGISCLLLPWGITSGDQLAESGAFSALTYMPHFILGIALVAWIFYFYLKLVGTGQKQKKKKYTVILSLLILCQGFNFPFFLFPFFASIFLSFFFSWLKSTKGINLKTEIRYLLFLILAGLVPVLYYAAVSFSHQFYHNWWWEQQTYGTLHPVYYLTGFGLLFILALYAWFSFLIKKKILYYPTVLVISWLSATILLSYSPVPFARRLLLGVHIPIVLLACFDLVQTEEKIRKWFITLVLSLALINALFLTWYSIYKTPTVSKFLYLDKQAYEALAWLQEHETEPTVVLSGIHIGNFIPAVAEQKTVLGQGSETFDVKQKNREVYRFFAETDNTDFQQKLIKKYDVSYIYHGPDEKELGLLDPAKLPYLGKVYDQDPVQLYKIKLDSL